MGNQEEQQQIPIGGGGGRVSSRLAKKRAASDSVDDINNNKKKRVVLGELTNLTNLRVSVNPNLNHNKPPPNSKANSKAKRHCINTLSKVPSQTRAPLLGSRISAAYLPHGRFLIPLLEEKKESGKISEEPVTRQER